jgi:pre-mRNA-splicing factor ATP-dependent RNA helicase DHX38/PRP16
MSDPSRDSAKGNDPHRLTSLLPSTGRGGLMKPPPSAASAATSGGDGGTQQSQQPRASLLGLDRLAASKRKDNADAASSSASNSSKPQPQARQYRRSNETPVPPSQQHQQHPVDVRRQQRRDHPYQPATERRRPGGSRQGGGGDDHGRGSGGGNSDDHGRGRGGNGNDYDRRDNYDSHERRDNRRSRPGDSATSGSGSSYQRQNESGGSRRDEGPHDRSGSGRSSSRGPNRSSRRDDPDDSYRRPRDYSQQSSSRRDDDRHRDNSNDRNNNNDSYRDGRGGQRRGGSEASTANRGTPQVTPSTIASRNDGSQFRSYRQQDRGGNGGGSGRGRRLEDAPTPGRQSSQHQQRMPSSQQRRGGNNNDAWEVETPAPLARDNDVDAALIEPADEDFDRDFYLQEDEGHAVQDATNDNDLGRFLYTNAKIEARQEAMDKQQKEGGGAKPRQNARQSALNHDQQAWEENRLLSAGAAVQGTVDLDHVTEQDTSVTLLVHQVKPPFLDGRVSFSTVREAVPTVRDASSDFSKMAREGSVTLRALRANKDKNAMRQKFWELGGTHMGNVMGVKETGDDAGDKDGKDGDTKEDGPAEETADGEIDYKKSTGFKDHVKNKEGDGPVSHFAKSKTIRQQREFLPAFGVREELLNIIRENNVVIIVGATGSGTCSGSGDGKRFPVVCAAHNCDNLQV